MSSYERTWAPPIPPKAPTLKLPSTAAEGDEHQVVFRELKQIAWRLYDLTADFKQLEQHVDRLQEGVATSTHVTNGDDDLLKRKLDELDQQKATPSYEQHQFSRNSPSPKGSSIIEKCYTEDLKSSPPLPIRSSPPRPQTPPPPRSQTSQQASPPRSLPRSSNSPPQQRTSPPRSHTSWETKMRQEDDDFAKRRDEYDSMRAQYESKRQELSNDAPLVLPKSHVENNEGKDGLYSKPSLYSKSRYEGESANDARSSLYSREDKPNDLYSREDKPNGIYSREDKPSGYLERSEDKPGSYALRSEENPSAYEPRRSEKVEYRREETEGNEEDRYFEEDNKWADSLQMFGGKRCSKVKQTRLQDDEDAFIVDCKDARVIIMPKFK